MNDPTPGLLVSVRSPDEVEAAIEGGAGLIDVKEPARGALGRADGAVIAAVANQVAGRRPVSAAMGELIDWEMPDAPVEIDPGLSFVKFGLAGCGRRRGWAGLLGNLRTKIESQSSARLVSVVYADWRRAESPRPQEVVAFALNQKCTAVLIDTWEKDGSTLLDWMTLAELIAMRSHFRLARIAVALSGSLGRWQIRQLLPAKPDWFAVRGSACNGAGRNGSVCAERVRGLAAVLKDPESILNDSRLDIHIPEIPNPVTSAKETP